jgi:hypothetical protein
MPSHEIRKSLVSAHEAKVRPHHSQSGVTSIQRVVHDAYGDSFSPANFNPGISGSTKMNHMFGVHDAVIGQTTKMANTRPEGENRKAMVSQGLQRLVENTVGGAYHLANPGVLNQSVEGAHHHDSIHKGNAGIGHKKTQPERYGQVPFAGPKF